jgi:hypothetical protein
MRRRPLINYSAAKLLNPEEHRTLNIISPKLRKWLRGDMHG